MRAAGVAIIVAGALVACGGSDGDSVRREAGKTEAAPEESTTTTAPAAPPTPPAPTGPLVGAVPPEGLGDGATGPQVLALEQRLVDLKYDVGGAPDDRFTGSTGFAVTAFQKVAGLPRTGRATQDVSDALGFAQPPGPLVPDGGPNRVEIDLPKQVLLLWQNGALTRVLPVSSANDKRFCDEGRCRVARTPPGSFRVGYRLQGWHESDLGQMYNPVYYQVGIGIAIHGSRDVPPYPASHGCVRIPMFAAETFPAQVPDGTPVYVLDGTTPVVPIAPNGPQT